MKRAIVKITKEALEDFIPFPKGTKIVDVLLEDRHIFCSGQVEFVVEHVDFYELREGEVMPYVNCVLTGDESKWE
jgi:hypothetical protein